MSWCWVALGFLHVVIVPVLQATDLWVMWCEACSPIRALFSIPNLVSDDWVSLPIDWFLILQCHEIFISEWLQSGEHHRLKNHYQQHISSISIWNIFFNNLKWIQVLSNLKPSSDAWKMLVIFPHNWLCFMHTLQRFRFSGK